MNKILFNILWDGGIGCLAFVLVFITMNRGMAYLAVIVAILGSILLVLMLVNLNRYIHSIKGK